MFIAILFECKKPPAGKEKPPVIVHHKRFLLFQLSCQGSNLDFSDSESDVLPITPQDNLGAKVTIIRKKLKPHYLFFSTLVHESLRGTVRLNTRCPVLLSGSIT